MIQFRSIIKFNKIIKKTEMSEKFLASPSGAPSMFESFKGVLPALNKILVQVSDVNGSSGINI